MRVFIITTVFFLLAVFADTKQEILQNRKSLQSKTVKAKKISLKLKEVAKWIQREESKLEQIKIQISDLESKIEAQSTLAKEKSKELDFLKDSTEKLSQNKRELERKIVHIIAKDFSFSLIADESYTASVENLMVDEVLKGLNAIAKKELNKLKKDYENTNSLIVSYKKEIKSIVKYINDLKEKKKTLSNLKRKKSEAIKKLKKKKLSYKKEIERIRKEQNSLRATLKKLKIILENEKKEDIAQKSQTVNRSLTPNLNVRKIGSSYQAARVKKYRGAKTIAPLDDCVVKRKFGNYFDPIYKIKIFNESVVLKSRRKNSKVKNVLNGKVIFANETALLDKVVIIENNNGIHTIYAHLSKIAPTIRPGKRVRKGYVIGRVENELSFEVTQKNYHIDPLDLIKIN